MEGTNAATTAATNGPFESPPEDHDAPAPRREDLVADCLGLESQVDILGRVASTLAKLGFAGPVWPAQLIYLALISRHLLKPISVAMLGESSSGKSYVIDRVLEFFPTEAFYRFTGMSNKALVYSQEQFAHRMIVFCEGNGLQGEFLTYAIRSLLSEGRLDYEYTDPERKETVRIHKEGPTGLLTSSAGRVDYELSTRLLGVSVDDSPEFTAAIMLALARAAEGSPEPSNLEPFQALDRWIAAGSREVVIPFATRVAHATDGRAVRMRRDFGAILGLIRAHALLHQANRETTDRGEIIATLHDSRHHRPPQV